MSLAFGITAMLCSAAAQQVPPPGSPIEEVARYWLGRTSLPQALANPYEITPPGTVVSRGSSALAQSMELTTELVVPRLPINVFDRASVIKYNRMLQAVLPVDSTAIGGVPIVDGKGKILAPTPQTQAGIQSMMMSVSAWRDRMGLNTVFDASSHLYALHGATAAAARYPYMQFSAMHTDRNPAYFLTPEAAIGLGGSMLKGGAPIGLGLTFYDGPHTRLFLNPDPYRAFGLGTAGGLTQSIFLGRAAAPTEMLKNGSYFLSLEGYVQEGTSDFAGVRGHIKGIQFSPNGENRYELLEIYTIAHYPGIDGPRKVRRHFEYDSTSGVFTFPLPTGYGADYPVDTHIDVEIKYRETVGRTWKSFSSWIEATNPLTPEERLPHAEILSMSRSNGADGLPNGRVKLVVVGKPGSELRIEGVAAQDASDGPWSKVLTFNPNKPVTVVEMSENALPEGAQFLRVVTAKYHPSDAANARAAGISEDRILK